jgi:hypothetical protein
MLFWKRGNPHTSAVKSEKSLLPLLYKRCDDPLRRVKVFGKCGYSMAEIRCSPDLQIKVNSIFLNPKEDRNDANRQPPFRDPCLPHDCDCPSPSVRAENMDPDGKPVWKRNKKMQVLEILSFVSSQ